MKWVVSVALLGVASAIGCSQTPPPEPAAKRFTPPPATSPYILFRVARSGDKLDFLKGVDALVVTGDGRMISVGKTNASREVTVQKSVIRENKAAAVLFCGRELFCGAVRVHEDDLLGFDEFFIELAPWAWL